MECWSRCTERVARCQDDRSHPWHQWQGIWGIISLTMEIRPGIHYAPNEPCTIVSRRGNVTPRGDHCYLLCLEIYSAPSQMWYLKWWTTTGLMRERPNVSTSLNPGRGFKSPIWCFSRQTWYTIMQILSRRVDSHATYWRKLSLLWTI